MTDSKANRFRANLIEEPLSPRDGLMRLAAAIGRYVALEEIREEKAARALDQDASYCADDGRTQKK